MTIEVNMTTIQTLSDMNKVDVSQLATEQLPQSIYDAIVSSAEQYQNKVAIKYILDGDCIAANQIPFSKKLIGMALKGLKGKSFAVPYREITYNQLAASVTQVANALQTFGIERNDVTSIVMPNFPEMYFSLWGAETAGIANPINPLLEANIIKEIIETAGSKVLIALGPVPGSDIWQKILEIKDQIPSLKAVISVFGDDMPASETNKVPVYSFDKLIAKQKGHALNASKPSINDICSYFHTGGTTGLPKLAKHLHLNELTNAAQMNLISPSSPDDTVLIGLPVFHVNAAITGLAQMLLGSTILLAGPSGFRGKNIIKNLLTILDNYNVAMMTAVPTVYAGLLDMIAKGETTLIQPKNMKFALCGAAPLSPDLQAKFINSTGINLVEGYGSTEGTAVSTVMPVNSIAKEAAVGIPIPGITLRIGEISEEDGSLLRLCDTNEPGEILIAGNNVFPGYVDDMHNKTLWVTTEAGEKFVRTGDLGKLNEDGYLSLCGRKKELIIRGGHNIDPKMIEDAATTHKDVLLAAAVPRPDDYSGELPVLYVTLVENSTATQEQLKEHMQTHTPERAAIPKMIHVIDEMPLTAVGKLFKPELVCREINDVIVKEFKQSLTLADFNIQVRPDKKQGVLASIAYTGNELPLEQVESEVKAVLTPYSFNYRVVAHEASVSEVN